MKISTKEHDCILERINSFMAELEEMGVSSAIVSISCDIEDIGWIPSHFNAGDPLACRGLADDYLDNDDDDDDIFFSAGFGGPDDDGGGKSEAWKE